MSIALKSAGSLKMEFVFDSIPLSGQKVVVYERLYFKNTLIAQHTDRNNSDQTVEIKAPKIKTSAAGADGKKEILPAQQAVIVDTAQYEGLAYGQSYTMRGQVMDAATGKPILAEGREIISEVPFKVESNDVRAALR